jgi:hypothetical protein
MQLMPLQDLNIGFLEIKTTRKHPCDISIALKAARFIEKFDDTSILAVFDGIFGLCDEVGVVFGAHGCSLRGDRVGTL